MSLAPSQWYDLALAVIELAVASRRLGYRSASDLLGTTPSEPQFAAEQFLSLKQRRLVERVAFAISRMGARVPWRSDCLVQALAARRWLARHGIVSTLSIGVHKHADFAAHAWLTVEEEVVTGGDIAGFEPIVTRTTLSRQ